ncbi:adenylosuccinate lyase [Geojedonia litorea]|uniref:Adenylosuccinate lyase n=1 Tax=Geojedonia litorea TaxID=1268269 RepID=A0ABV9N2X4_9FLAO
MTTEQLYDKLSVMSALREQRLQNAQLIVDQPDLIPKLLDIVFLVDDEVSCRAAWVLEFVCTINLELIYPHLNRYFNELQRIHLDSAVRPVAKICELLTKAYYSKKDHSLQSILTRHHKEKIVECCFDWLINDEKIAPKAFAMTSLYLIGQDIDWIHPELEQILKRDFHQQSAGFKARAKQILNKIGKYRN